MIEMTCETIQEVANEIGRRGHYQADEHYKTVMDLIDAMHQHTEDGDYLRDAEIELSQSELDTLVDDADECLSVETIDLIVNIGNQTIADSPFHQPEEEEDWEDEDCDEEDDK